jgi:hypothetical protein
MESKGRSRRIRCRNNGMLEHWKNGVLEYRSDGVLGSRKDGIVEEWKREEDRRQESRIME